MQTERKIFYLEVQRVDHELGDVPLGALLADASDDEIVGEYAHTVAVADHLAHDGGVLHVVDGAGDHPVTPGEADRDLVESAGPEARPSCSGSSPPPWPAVSRPWESSWPTLILGGPAVRS